MASRSLELILNIVVRNAEQVAELKKQLDAISKQEIDLKVSNNGSAVNSVEAISNAVASVSGQVEGLKEVLALVGKINEATKKSSPRQGGSAAFELPPIQSVEDAISALQEMDKLGISLEKQFKLFNAELGVTQEQFNGLKDDAKEGVKVGATTSEIAKLAQGLKLSFEGAKELQASLNLPVDDIRQVNTIIQQLGSVDVPIDEQFEEVNRVVGVTREQFDKLYLTLQRPPSPAGAEAVKESIFDYLNLASTIQSTAKEAEALTQTLGLSSRQISQAFSAIQQLNTADISIDEQFEELSTTLGLTREQFDGVANAVARVDFRNLGESIGMAEAEARAFSESLNIDPRKLGGVVFAFKELEAQGLSSKDIFKKLEGQFDLTRKQFEGIFSKVGKSENPLKKLSSGAGGLLKSLTDVAFSFNSITVAAQGMFAAISPIYQSLIASNEQLNAQILTSQTNLASSTRIFSGGVEITDATDKINATQETLKAALKKIEVDTRDLVGVTSSEVNELFQITLGNAAALNQQSKDFAGPIEAATKLTTGWAASLKVVGVPLNQARQEINSIIKGQIDNNSVLGKNLNITNQQVAKWKAQGVLVDELNKRLDTFVAGNAIAAKSIDGVTSNIRDIFEIFGRTIGEPLLAPAVEALEKIFAFLDGKQDQLADFFGGFITAGLEAAQRVTTALAPIFEPLMAAATAIGGPTLELFQALVDAGAGVIESIAPIATVLMELQAIGAEIVATSLADVLVVIAEAIGMLASVAAEPIKLIAESLSALLSTDAGRFIAQIAITTAALAALNTTLGVSGLIASANAFAKKAIPAAISALAKFKAALLAANAQAVATGGLSGLPAIFTAIRASAIRAATQGIPALIASLKAAAVAAAPFLLAMAPLIALGGAITLTFIVKKTGDIKNVQKELDTLQQFTVGLSEGALETAAALDRLSKAGANLTDEQLVQLKQAETAAKQRLASIDEQISALKGQDTKGNTKGQQQAIDNQIEALKKTREGALDSLESLSTQVGLGKSLTKEQLDQIGQAESRAKVQLANIERQIENLKSVDTKGNEAQANQIKGQIGDLENKRKLLTKELNQLGRGDGLEIQGKALEELGTSYDQLTKKAENSLRSIAEGAGGDPTVFNQSVKELIETTKQQVELGQISREEAAERLTAVANNTKVEVGLQQSAVEAIGNIREGGLKLTTQQLEAEKSAIEAAALLGGQAQIDAAKDSAKVQQDILNARIKDNKDAIAAEKAAIEAGTGSDTRLQQLLADEAKLGVERVKTAQDTAKGIIDAEKQINDVRRQGIQDQIRDTERAAKTGELGGIEAAKKVTQLKQQELQTQIEDTARAIAKEQQLISEGTGNETRLATLRAEQEKLNDQRADLAIEGEENVRQKEIEVIQRTATARAKAEADLNLKLAETRASGVDDAIEAEQKKLQAAIDRGEKEIQAELKKLEILKQAPQTGSNKDAVAQQEIAITKLKTQQIEQREALERKSIERLERDRRIAEEQISISQAERNNEIAARENRLRAAGAAEVDVRRSISQEQTAIQAEDIARRLADEKNYQAELERLQASGQGGDPEQLEATIRQSKLKTAQLVGEQIANEKAQREQLTEQIIADIERERKASETARQAIISGIERQQQLQQSAANLASSVVAVELAQLNQRKALTTNDKERQRIELQIAEIQRKALIARQAGERLSLELTQKRALIENQIAQTNARAALRKARTEGATAEDLADLQKNVSDFAALGDVLKTTQDQEREALANNQKAERIGADTDVRLAQRAISDAGKNVGDSLNGAAKKIKESAKDVADRLKGLGKDDIDPKDFKKLSLENRQKLSRGEKLGESVEDRQRRAQGLAPGQSVEDFQKGINGLDESPELLSPTEATAENTAKTVAGLSSVKDAIEGQTKELTGAISDSSETTTGEKAKEQIRTELERQRQQAEPKENIDQQTTRALLERVSPEEAIARETGMIEAITKNLASAPSSEQRQSLQTERAMLEGKAKSGGLTDEENTRLTDVIGELSRSFSDGERAKLEKEKADRGEVRSRLEEGGNQQDVRNLRDLYLERAGIGRSSEDDRALKFVQDEQTLLERGAAIGRARDAQGEQTAKSEEASAALSPEMYSALYGTEKKTGESVDAIETQTQAIDTQTDTLKDAIEGIPRPKAFRDGTGGIAATPVGTGFVVGEAGAELVTDPTTGQTKLFTGESFIASDRPLIVRNAAETSQLINPVLPVPSMGGLGVSATSSRPATVTASQGMDGAALWHLSNQLDRLQQGIGQVARYTAQGAAGASSTASAMKVMPQILNGLNATQQAQYRELMSYAIRGV
jgi:hypothetical protein